jgi:hypothetical protein
VDNKFMRVSALIYPVLAAFPLDAQMTVSLGVRNLSVEGDKQIVSFDVVNSSAKSVLNWTMTVHSKKQGFVGGVSGTHDANLLADGCSGSGVVPLTPGSSHHCTVSMYSGEQARVLSAEVVFTSVLFADGSAEGDVSLLDGLARRRLSIIRTLEFWIGRLSPSLSAGTPQEQLQAMQQALSVPDSEVPEDLRYDPTAMQERRTLLSQVTFSLQMLDDPRIKNPQAQAAGSVALLRQRLDRMRSEPDPFPPRRDAELSPAAGDPLHGWKAVARTAALRLVAVRESDTRSKMTTLVLQNQTAKGITAFAVSFGNSTDSEGASQTHECFESAMPVCVLPGGSVSLFPSSRMARILNIDAVVFEDGSGDGARSAIDAMQYSRLGRMFETERIRSILESADTDFGSIPARLGSLPQSPAEALASMVSVNLPGIALDRIRQADSRSLVTFFAGVRNTREDAIRRMPEYELRAGSPAGALAEMRREFHDLSNQYRAYCQELYEGVK